MRNDRKQLPADSRTGAKAWRRLQFEPLESRAVLSIIGFGPMPAITVGPMIGAASAPPERVLSAEFGPSAPEAVARAVLPVDRYQADGPATAAPGLPSLWRALLTTDYPDGAERGAASVSSLARPGTRLPRDESPADNGETAAAGAAGAASLSPGAPSDSTSSQAPGCSTDSSPADILVSGSGGGVVFTIIDNESPSLSAPVAPDRAPTPPTPPEADMTVQIMAMGGASYNDAPPIELVAMAHSMAARPPSPPHATDAPPYLTPASDSQSAGVRNDAGRQESAIQGAYAVSSEGNPAGQTSFVSSPYQAAPTTNGTSTLNSLRTSGSDGQEGGYVDIDGLSETEAAQPMPGDAKDLPSANSAASGDRDGKVPRDARAVAADTDPPDDQSTDQLTDSAAPGGKPAATLNSDEGGAVDLAAIPADDAKSVPHDSPLPADAERVAEVKDVPLYNGLGLFHAFELATEPTEPGAPSAPTAERGEQAAPPAAATAVPLSDASAPHEKTGADRPVLETHAGLQPVGVSSIVLASLLAVPTRVQREEPTSKRPRWLLQDRD